MGSAIGLYLSRVVLAAACDERVHELVQAPHRREEPHVLRRGHLQLVCVSYA